MHRQYLDGRRWRWCGPWTTQSFAPTAPALRVTSDGRIKPCLLRSDNLIDIDTCDSRKIEELLQQANSLRRPYFSNNGGDGCGAVKII